MDEITWQSVPDISGGWFDSGWTLTQWMQWNDALEAEFGTDEAQKRFNAEWNKQGWLDNETLIAAYDPAWIAYWKDRGYDVRDGGSKLFYGLSNALGNIGLAAENTTGNLAETGNSWGKFIKYLPWIVGGLVVIVVVAVVYVLVKKPEVIARTVRPI